MKHIAWIINPISGTVNKADLPDKIRRHIDPAQFDCTIVFTQYAGHATTLAADFAAQGYDAVVAVGGDGTLHEVACGLKDTPTALGIIPLGSGNGFARHLHIPTQPDKAIQLINHSTTIPVDYGYVNEMPFFSTCGIGFDALVAHQFAHDTGRGFTHYFQHIFKDLFSYRCENYHLEWDGKKLDTQAFLITFANAGQWGYDAYIAPHADLQDGMMDIAILTKFPILAAPKLAIELFTRRIDQTEAYVHIIRTNELTLTRPKEGPMHIDGDPLIMPDALHLRMVPAALKVMVERSLGV